MTFLLIDSSRVMRDIERELLLEHWPAAEVFDAPSAELAAPYAVDRYKPIDLVVFGWNIGAPAVIAGLREMLPEAPILLVAPRTAEEAILTAIQAGASNYLYKPFIPEVLIDKVHSTLDQSGRIRSAA